MMTRSARSSPSISADERAQELRVRQGRCDPVQMEGGVVSRVLNRHVVTIVVMDGHIPLFHS